MSAPVPVVPLQCDKFRKAFSYLEAAMYFVESGIAIDRDPQMSSYTMFAETAELLKYEPTFVIIDLNHHRCCVSLHDLRVSGSVGSYFPFFSSLSGM